MLFSGCVFNLNIYGLVRMIFHFLLLFLTTEDLRRNIFPNTATYKFARYGVSLIFTLHVCLLLPLSVIKLISNN